MATEPKILVWIDLEMTGLEPMRDTIIEIACIVTDNDLNVLAEGPNLAIHVEDAVLAGMDDWNKNQHGKSGLVERVRASQESLATAEEQTLAFIANFCGPKTSPLGALYAQA
jgi:oligoribonuclease